MRNTLYVLRIISSSVPVPPGKFDKFEIMSICSDIMSTSQLEEFEAAVSLAQVGGGGNGRR